MINPEGLETAYFFEYGPTTAYGTNVPATQDADAGSTNQVGQVLRRIDNLQPGSTYHYRLVATNGAGTTNGADQTFTTGTQPSASIPRPGIPGAGVLADNRGWEKLSPGDKNGADITADTGRTRMAADGSAATLSSLSAFGDVIGTSVATDYMSVRGALGWTTHAITPPQRPSTVKGSTINLQSVYSGFSADLSKGLFLAWSPVTADPNVANVANLYRRDDPKAPGAGSYQLLSACPLCASTSTPLPPLPSTIFDGILPRFASASADFGHVIFESRQPLTGDVPGGCTNLADHNQCPGNLYEWDHGTLRLAGILPDSACGSPPCPAHGSVAGQGAGGNQVATKLTPHTISADGSRIFFVAPETGNVYMRVNHSTTVQLNTSERATPDPSGAQSATYHDASVDGSRVFFSTTEALTDNAPLSTTKLYMYDASKPDSDPTNLTLISVDTQPDDLGEFIALLGVSGDGGYVYFVTAGQLVSGQPLLGLDRGLYAWHDGVVRYVTSLGAFTDSPEDTNSNSWSFTQPTTRVTPDGLHLLFSSTAVTGPTGYDQGQCQTLDVGCRELYLYDYTSQRLACASCNQSGLRATASASIAARSHTSVSATSSAQSHPLSNDGRHVFFSTAEALVAHDTNGKADVYEYDAPTGTVHLLTNGIDRSDSYFMDASPTGDDVLLLTRAQLGSADVDSNYDLYDARVDGGYHDPPPPRRGCAGDACQGAQSQVPEAPPRGSSLITGSGRPAPPKVKPRPKPKRCRKGYVRKKVRGKTTCVKKNRAHKTRKTTHSQRRAK